MASAQTNRLGPVVFRNTDAARHETLGMRAARIDQLGVDQSHLAHYPIPIASPEMARREQRLERRFGRSQVTSAERLAAWRQFSLSLRTDR